VRSEEAWRALLRRGISIVRGDSRRGWGRLATSFYFWAPRGAQASEFGGMGVVVEQRNETKQKRIGKLWRLLRTHGTGPCISGVKKVEEGRRIALEFELLFQE
jgi:hypothetical protein